MYTALSQGLNGRAGPMLQLTNVYRTSVEFPAYTAVECTDSPHPVGATAYQAFAQELIGLSSRFGGTVANELLPCAYWGAPVESIVASWDLTMKQEPVWTWPAGLRFARFFTSVR